MTNGREQGYIYAIGTPGSQLIKIGWTSGSAQRRIEYLQTGAARPLIVLQEILVEHPRRVERWLHTFLAAARVHGEWFKLDHTRLPGLVAQALQELPSTDVVSPQVGERVTFRLSPALAALLQELIAERAQHATPTTLANLVREALQHYATCDTGQIPGRSPRSERPQLPLL